MHTGKSPVNPSIEAIISWCRRTHALPEGYLDGIDLLLSDNQTRETFMDGVWSVGSTPSFFPYTLWVKTPPALWLFILLAAVAWVARLWPRGAAQKNPASSSEFNYRSFLYNAAPYLALVVVFCAVALAQNMDMAHRHILPIYAPIYILAGGAVGWLCLQRGRAVKVLVAVLTLGYAGDSLHAYPNYLAYFSPVVGGSAHGYQRLAESSLDWGMDLPGLKVWLDLHSPYRQEPVYLSYFGTDNPEYYGIKSTRLPSFPAWEREGVYNFQPGIYAISATIFDGFYLDLKGPWNSVFEDNYQTIGKNLQVFDETANAPEQRAALLKKYPLDVWGRTYANYKNLRFGRLCAWLRHHRQPDDNAGHSILIWRLNQKEIDEALKGPPAEIANNSPWLVRTKTGRVLPQAQAVN
jgi:hypothetical protein